MESIDEVVFGHDLPEEKASELPQTLFLECLLWRKKFSDKISKYCMTCMPSHRVPTLVGSGGVRTDFLKVSGGIHFGMTKYKNSFHGLNHN